MGFVEEERTSTLEQEFDGEWIFTHAIPATDVPRGRVSLAEGGGLNGSTWKITTTEFLTSTGHYNVEVYMEVQLRGVTDFETFYLVAPGNFTPPGSFSTNGTYTGSFVTSEDTVVIRDVVSEPYDDGTHPHPPDLPQERTIYQIEKSRVGGYCVATLTFMEHQVKVGPTLITTGNRRTMEQKYRFVATCNAFDNGKGAFGGVPTLNGIEFPTGYSQTHGAGTVTSWSAEITAPNNLAAEASMDEIVAYIDRPITSRGKVLRWDGSEYPVELTVRIEGFDIEVGDNREVAFTGSWDETYTQQRYTIGSHIHNGSSLVTASDGKNTHAPVRTLLTAASLIAAGEDSHKYVRRILQRADRFDGIEIQHAETLAVTGGSGNSRTYSPFVGMSGYAYLDVQVTSTTGDDETRTLEITDAWGMVKSWELMAPASGVTTTRRIDLTCPGNASVPSDGWDNPYPRPNPDDNTYWGDEGTDTQLSGITKAQKIELLGSGVNLGTLTLVRDATATSTFMSPLRELVEILTKRDVAEVGTQTEYYGFRGWHQNVDGRNEEEPWMTWQKTTGGATTVENWSYSPVSIAGLCDRIEAVDSGVVRHPGWTATPSTDPPADCTMDEPPILCLLNSQTGEACWLMGLGILAKPAVSGDGTDFQVGADIDCTGPVTVPAQYLFDRIAEWLGDKNDTFNVSAGALDRGLFLAGAQLLGAQGHGVVYDDGVRMSGEIVTMTRTTTGDAGDDTTGGDGLFFTGEPFAKAEIGHTIATSSFVAAVGITSKNRRRHRASFRMGDTTEEAGQEVSIYRDATDQAFFYTVRASDMALVVYRYHGQGSDPTTGQVFVIDSSGSANNPCAFMYAEEVHYCAYLLGTTLKLATSRDSGRTWVSVTIPGTCEKFRMCEHRDRVIVVKYRSTAWYVQVGTIDPSTGSISWSSEQALLAAGVGSSAGDVKARHDNVIEFGYVTPAGVPTVTRCHTLATDGTGAWHA